MIPSNDLPASKNNISSSAPNLDTISEALAKAQKIVQSVEAANDTLKAYHSEMQETMKEMQSFKSSEPQIAKPKNEGVYSNPNTSTNPYFAGSSMAAVFMVLQEILQFTGEMRELQTQTAIATQKAVYNSSMDNAILRMNVKMNQAFQTFTQAMGEFAGVGLSAFELSKRSFVDVNAQEGYDEELSKQQKKVTDAEDLLRKYAPPKPNAAAATDPQALQDSTKAEIEKYEADFKAAASDPDKAKTYFVDYDNKKESIDKKIAVVKEEKKTLQNTEENKANILASKRQQIEGIITAQSQMYKSAKDGITQSALSIMQMSSANLDKEQAEKEAMIELLRNFMQSQDQAVQQARSAIDEINRMFQQLSQSYTSSLSNRA